MTTQKLSRWLAAPLALALAALACGGGGSPEPSATPFASPKPTLKPAATATEAPATEAAQPTKEPQATKTPKAQATSATAPFTLAAETFAHSSGAFSINLPEGWEPEERSDGVYAASADGVASLDVSFTNAGLTFDETELDTYIEAMEQNWFGGFTNYTQESKEPQKDGSILVLKTFELDNRPRTVFSYYWQAGTVIYEEDFWADSDQYDAYADSFVEVANSAQTDPTAAEQSPLYEFRYTFTGPNSEFQGPSQLFEFSVPYGWAYSIYSEENAVADTFTSPDGLTKIENITYDDGTAVSRSEAGRFALTLLKDFYSVNDIKVTDDEVQADGSERLNWVSESGGFEGTSFFETRGTTFLLLTWIVNSEHYDLFFPVWQDLLSSYAVPQP